MNISESKKNNLYIIGIIVVIAFIIFLIIHFTSKKVQKDLYDINEIRDESVEDYLTTVEHSGVEEENTQNSSSTSTSTNPKDVDYNYINKKPKKTWKSKNIKINKNEILVIDQGGILKRIPLFAITNIREVPKKLKFPKHCRGYKKVYLLRNSYYIYQKSINFIGQTDTGCKIKYTIKEYDVWGLVL